MSKKKFSREELLGAIREAAPPRGVEWETRKRGLALRTFSAKTGWRMCHIQKYFPTWNEALAAAGGDVGAHLTCLSLEEMLADWGLVARKLQRPPPFTHYNYHGKYAARTLQLRVASWHNVRAAFREFAKGKEEWADVVKLCDMPARAVNRNSRVMYEFGNQEADPRQAKLMRRGGMMRPIRLAQGEPVRQAQSSGVQLEDRPVYGEPLGPMALRNAPTNESGVVLVFGMLAEQLGFHIQAVRTAFPDCDALRKVGESKWQNVTIEFEFKSSNFHEHGHPPNGCDLIVCWMHDWAGCPENLEVIALRDYIAQGEMTKHDSGRLDGGATRRDEGG